MNQPYFVLVNPQAQAGHLGRTWFEKEAQIIEAIGHDQIQFEFTSPEEPGEALVRNALKQGIKNILVVGGDGTISQAVHGFFEKDERVRPEAVLSILPAGRGNDFFRSLINDSKTGGEQGWKKGLDILRSGKPVAVDIGRIQWFDTKGNQLERKRSRYFINIASFGFSGSVVEHVQSRKGFLKKQALGGSSWAYILASLAALPRYQSVVTRITVDQERVMCDRVFMGMILNGRFSGNGMCWNHKAAINDGLLNLLVMEDQPTPDLLKNFFQVFKNRPDGLSRVKQFAGKQIHVELVSDGVDYSFFEVDGEVPRDWASLSQMKIEILPSAIQIFGPIGHR